MRPLSTPEELERRFPNGPRPKAPVPYAVQWWMAVVVTVLLLTAGAITAFGPEELGISPVAFRWIGVATIVLGGVSGFLPKLQSPPDGRR